MLNNFFVKLKNKKVITKNCVEEFYSRCDIKLVQFLCIVTKKFRAQITKICQIIAKDIFLTSVSKKISFSPQRTCSNSWFKILFVYTYNSLVSCGIRD